MKAKRSPKTNSIGEGKVSVPVAMTTKLRDAIDAIVAEIYGMSRNKWINLVLADAAAKKTTASDAGFTLKSTVTDPAAVAAAAREFLRKAETEASPGATGLSSAPSEARRQTK